MDNEKPKVKLQFAPLDPAKDERGRVRRQSPTVEISNGTYRRVFDVKDEPFECPGLSRTEGEGVDAHEVAVVTPDEEVEFLLRTGHFIVAEPVAPQPKPMSGKIGVAPPPAE